MKRKFVNNKGEQVDIVPYILKVLVENPGATIYVGSDSQKKKKTIDYATVIAIRYGFRGAHVIHNRWSVKRKGYGRGDALIEKRLTVEIAATMEIADYLRRNSISIYQIDLDLNGDPKWKSNKFVQMGVGWASGLGFKVAIKPEEVCAAKAANHIVNH